MMPKDGSHYQSFDVMQEKDHWDDHTREIVEKRLLQKDYQQLSLQESILLTHICAQLLDEARDPILHYVVQHFDTMLGLDIGESQRKANVPKAAILIREGIRAIDQYATSTYGMQYAALPDTYKRVILEQMMNNQITLTADGIQIPVKELFNKLQKEAVHAYYSHPTVWSEIGYAGPAYPRGYVRSELGQRDPWEAKREDE